MKQNNRQQCASLPSFLNDCSVAGIGRVESKMAQCCLPKSCHSLNLGMENFAGVISGKYWPGRAKDDSRLLAEQLPFAELRYRKFRRAPQRPVMADWLKSPKAAFWASSSQNADMAD